MRDSDSKTTRRDYLKTTGAATVGGAALAGCLGIGGGGGGSIRVFLWEGYGPIVKDFEEQHDITVEVEKATSTNNMFTKAKSAPDRYDLVAPNSGYASRFREAGLVQPVADSKEAAMEQIPNLANTFDYFRQGTIADHLSDSSGAWYGVPPRFGLYGLAVDSNNVDPSKLQSSADLWANKDLWADDVGVNVDPVHSITHAVRALGYTDMLRGDEISVSGSAWEETKSKFLELADMTRAMFESEAQFGRAMKGDSYNVGVGPGRNDVINLIKKGNESFEFVAPKEGAIGWTEAMLLMKNSSNKESVQTFMNYFLTAKAGAKLAVTDLAPSTVEGAKNEMSQQEQDLFYIPPEDVQDVIQDKPFAEPEKWKQLMSEFRTRLG